MNLQNQQRTSLKKSLAWVLSFGWILLILLSLQALTSMGRWVQPPGIEPRSSGVTTWMEGAKDIRPLELGKLIQRELGGGKSHFYQLALTSGQYVHAGVSQLGIDVTLTLFGPDGKKVTRIDISDGTEREEPLRLIAAATGVYLIEVRSLEVDGISGRYQIGMDEQHAATPQDKRRAAAEQAYIEGMHLRRKASSESQKQSIDRFSDASRAWHSAGFPVQEAEALVLVGEGYYNLSQYPSALEAYNRALPIFRELGHRDGEAWTLNNIGRVYGCWGENQQALAYFRKALELYSSVSEPRGIGIASTNLGALYDSLGEKQKALDHLNRSLRYWRAANDRKGEARALHFIGAVHASLGENRIALEFYKRALPLWGDEHLRRAATLNNLGVAYATLHINKTAHEFLLQALLLRKKIGDIRGEASTLHSLGHLLYSMGDGHKALDSYSNALPLFRSLGDRAGEADTLTNIGIVHQAMGDSPKALDFLQKALSLRRAVGNLEAEAHTLYWLAQSERDLGSLDAAVGHIEEALNIPEYVRTNISVNELRISYFTAVRDYYGFYLDLLWQLNHLHPSSGYDAKAFQASERARARNLLDALADTRTKIRQDANPQLLKQERGLHQRLQAKLDYLALLVRGTGTPGQKSAIIKEIEALQSEYEAVQAQIRATSPRYSALTQPQPLTLQEIQQQILDENTVLLEYSLGDERSYVWEVSAATITVLELPKRIEIETVARRVYKSLTARNMLVKGETPEGRRARLDEAEAEYLKSSWLLSRMILGPIAEQLGNKRLLIVSEGTLQYVPFAALPIPGSDLQLASTQKLQNGGDGPASVSQRRPAAPEPHPLVLEHEIVNLPSASILAVMRRELASRKPAPKTVAILADPVFSTQDPRVRPGRQPEVGSRATPSSSGSLAPAPQSLAADLLRSAKEVGLTDSAQQIPRLLSTRREASVIASFVAAEGCRQALDFEANRATATSPELSQYRIVHFATHGLLNSQHPELSGLILSLVDAQGRPQDGFFRLQDIYNLRLPADLVVLSACQTGLGKDVKGEGLIGLTRGFMAAGAARVLASLWKVDDASTAELMKHFYAGMLGEQHLNPAAALRAAQIAMCKQNKWRSPYYWAAFILQGEWK